MSQILFGSRPAKPLGDRCHKHGYGQRADVHVFTMSHFKGVNDREYVSYARQWEEARIPP